MDEIDPSQVERATHLLKELPDRLERLPITELREGRFDSAIAAVSDAILRTRKYLRHRREGGDRVEESERELSEAWARATKEIQEYDPFLAGLCEVKSNGWADDATWSAEENKNLPLSVDAMLQRLRELRQNVPYVAAPWERIVAIVVAVLIVGMVLFLVIRNQPFADPNLVLMLRIVLSVAMGIIGAVIPFSKCGFDSSWYADSGRWSVGAIRDNVFRDAKGLASIALTENLWRTGQGGKWHDCEWAWRSSNSDKGHLEIDGDRGHSREHQPFHSGGYASFART